MEDLALLGGRPIRTSPFPMEMPQISEDDIRSVTDVLRSSCLSIFSNSNVVDFERAFAGFVGTKYAVAVTSGTAALQASLAAIGVGSGDEVILPVYTYAASANAILLQNGVPVFVDVNPRTFNIDVTQIESRISPRTKAILLVDLFGNPTARTPILEIAARHGLRVVEDCAQSTGARVHDQQVGSFDVGCHSFGEIKNITSAEGGMITTNDPEIARKARLVRHAGEAWRKTHTSTIGASPSLLAEMIDGIDYEMIGHNYRMNALQAALGSSQLKRINEINGKRARNGEFYLQAFVHVPDLELPTAENDAEHVFNRFVFLLGPNIQLSRNAFLAALISEGIPAGVYYPNPLNRASLYQERIGYGSTHCPFECKHARKIDYEESFPNAEYVCKRQVLLPSYPGLQARDLKDVVSAVLKVLNASSSQASRQMIEEKASSIRAVYFGQFFSIDREAI